MLALTAPRIALVALASLGLLTFAAILLSGNAGSDSAGVALVGPVGSLVMGAFATSCAAGAAWAAQGRQSLAWLVLSIGLGGWTIGDSVWCYVGLGGMAPLSDTSVADLGYVVLPLCALVAALVVPSRDDSRFGIGLLLDGILVAASLSMVLGVLAIDHGASGAHAFSFPRALLITIAAVYLGLVVMTSLVTKRASPERRLSPGLLAAGFAVIGTAGLARVYLNRPDQLPDKSVILGWVGGLYLVALSAIASRPGPDLDAHVPQTPSRVSIWLPYVPFSVAVGVAIVHEWPANRADAFLFSVGLVLILTATARHFLALERKQRLYVAVSDAARRDTVTGLANRKFFDERLAHAVQLYVQQAVPVSVIRVRVDDFKVFNDPLGYAAGHELLRSVGERIQANARTADTVARMAADDFAILVEDVPEAAALVAERLARAFDSALDIRDHQVHVSLSIGVASAGSDDSALPTASDLLDRADAARHRAGQAGTTDVRTFTPELDAHSGERQAFRDGIARLELLGDLRRAIHDSSLTLVYQPKFGMLTGSVCGAEALVRWKHPRLGVLEPREFLPLVREHRLMDALTDFVLVRAIADASDWREAGTAIPVAVNVWARALDDDTLPDRIMSVLDAHAMSASSLTVEITEDLMVADLAKGRTVLDHLRDAGIRVAIDDFGSGYSTLTYLRELPIDEVKLDYALIAPILYDQRAAMIARSAIDLADAFGITSVAEGVEDRETALKLKEFGCDAVQGNFFCRPLPAREILGVSSNSVLAAQ
jgi:diguanylate cyclase